MIHGVERNYRRTVLTPVRRDHNMSHGEVRNDAKAVRLIDMLYAEAVSPENITRLLNYHFTDEVFQCRRDAHERSIIERVPNNGNYAPPVQIWKQS